MSQSSQTPAVPAINPGQVLLHLTNYTADPIGFFEGVTARSDDVTRVIAGAMNVFVVSKPSDVEDILVKRAHNFTPVSTPALRKAGPEALVNSNGYLHQRMKTMLAPVYSREAVASHASVIVEETARMRERWREGTTLDIERQALILTVASSNRILFGDDDQLEPRELKSAVKAADFLSAQSTHVVISSIASLPVMPQTRRYQSWLDQLGDGVAERIALRRSSPNSGNDLARLMLQAHGEHIDARLTDQELRDEIVSFMTAGCINLPVAMTWTLMLLAQHPNTEAQVLREIDDVLEGALPTVDDIERLALTRAVIRESLRLYPPAWLIGRNVLHDFPIGDALIPSGSLIAISPYVIHRSERNFANPTCFDPSRWTPGREKDVPPFAYMPFSGGPRGCMGGGFADVALTLMIPTLLQRWAPRLPPGFEPALQPGITLRPRNGLSMTLFRR